MLLDVILNPCDISIIERYPADTRDCCLSLTRYVRYRYADTICFHSLEGGCHPESGPKI